MNDLLGSCHPGSEVALTGAHAQALPPLICHNVDRPEAPIRYEVAWAVKNDVAITHLLLNGSEGLRHPGRGHTRKIAAPASHSKPLQCLVRSKVCFVPAKIESFNSAVDRVNGNISQLCHVDRVHQGHPTGIVVTVA